MAKTSHISIEWVVGRGDAADEARAEAAAWAVFAAAGVVPADGEAEYLRQFADLDGEDGMTGAAVVYVQARDAAGIAATEGWHQPNGGQIEIRCGAV